MPANKASTHLVGNKTEILYLVKKGGHAPSRPSLIVNKDIEINPALLHLIRDCWAERPSERPSVDVVKSSLKAIDPNRLSNFGASKMKDLKKLSILLRQLTCSCREVHNKSSQRVIAAESVEGLLAGV
ncbi:hypothetical protein OSTOST_01266 [Ostertagia ostertagi]